MQSVQTKDPATAVSATIKPFQIRGRFITAVALHISGETDDAFYAALDAQLRQTPHFFFNAPFVLDLEDTDSLRQKAELAQLIRELRTRNLSVFGVQNGTTEQITAAREAGLISLQGTGRDAPLERVEKDANRPAKKRAEPTAPSTVVVTDPVRSGQTLFSDGDLIVVSSVGSGAELVAGGNIHVYGQLRGRALAGVNGDETARIFCQSLDAELIAIAGLFQTSEDFDDDLRKQRVQAFLHEDSLRLEPLK